MPMVCCTDFNNAESILSREEIRRAADIVKEIVEAVHEVQRCRKAATEIVNRCCYSFDIDAPIRVVVMCDKLFTMKRGELRIHNTPAALVMEGSAVAVYSIDGAPSGETEPHLLPERMVGLVDLKNANLKDIILLTAYEKHCRAVTRMAEKLKEYVENAEKLVKILRDTAVATKIVFGP